MVSDRIELVFSQDKMNAFYYYYSGCKRTRKAIYFIKLYNFSLLFSV